MKYIIILLSIYLAVACDAKSSTKASEAVTDAHTTAVATTVNNTSADLKAELSEKAEMTKDKMMEAKDDMVQGAKDKMDNAKDVMESKANVMADKAPSMDKMKDGIADAKAEMKDKVNMAKEEVPMAKEQVTETVVATASAAASTAVASTPVIKEVMKEKKEAMPVEEKKAMPVAGVDHSILDGLLKKYVSSTGVVNYAGIQGSRAQLDEYLDLVSKKIPDNSWSRNEALAYWINVYNANTIDLILSNYPISSITNLDGGKPWDVKRITIAGKKYSLNDIEHSIIRPEFNDARIHFAVNCAAKSCPKLNNGAMTAANVNSTLEKLTKEFVNNSSINKISSNSASLSKIFEWYASDFGNLTAFINKYSTQKLNVGSPISYVDYDWSLNGK
jgi:hypothetical protein